MATPCTSIYQPPQPDDRAFIAPLLQCRGEADHDGDHWWGEVRWRNWRPWNVRLIREVGRS